MLFLGIDPGYGRLGYGLIRSGDKSGRAEYEACGVIESSKDLDDGQRLLVIEKGLEKIIRQREITLCAVEDIFFRKNLTTGVRLIQARGVVLLVLARHRIPFESVSPTHMKKMITGHGKADKKQIQIMIRKLLNLNEIPKPDDAADALCFALCSWLMNKTRIKVQEKKPS